MKKPSFLILFGAFVLPKFANADVSVQSHTSPSSMHYMMTEDALMGSTPQLQKQFKPRFTLGSAYNWVNDPLVEVDPNREQRFDTLIAGIHTLDLTAGIYFIPRISLNATLSLNAVHPSNVDYVYGLGDTRVFAKFRLTGDQAPVAVALIPEIRLPTGRLHDQAHITDQSYAPGLMVAFERDFSLIRATFNIGYRYASEARYRDINYTQRVPLNLGIYIPVTERFGINTEAAANVVIPLDRHNSPAELYAGLRYFFSHDVVLAAGASVGSYNSALGNDYRILASLNITPSAEPEPDVIPLPAPIVKVEEPAKKPVEVVKRVIFTPKEIKISEEIQFKHNSAVLTAQGKDLLDEVARTIKDNRTHFRRIKIEGHTNELGTSKHNMKLSVARAKSVKQYLSTRGIDSDLLSSYGYGKTRPKYLPGVAKEEQLRQNRRVEFKVVQ